TKADGSPVTPPATASAAAGARAAGDDGLCDVLRHDEFVAEVTEILLSSAPTLTGSQILQVRAGMLEFATKRGWIEG
ncbi:cold shock domain-containing protein, partial [Streptomyces sp. SID5998]|nr:cold shock domain-containing protein [Streptomyces sp. SID5998]